MYACVIGQGKGEREKRKKKFNTKPNLQEKRKTAKYHEVRVRKYIFNIK